MDGLTSGACPAIAKITSCRPPVTCDAISSMMCLDRSYDSQ